MSAFCGLSIKKGMPNLSSKSFYIAPQPSFKLTKDFTLKNLIERYRHAQSVCADTVYVPSSITSFSDSCLDIWYVEALIQHLLLIEKEIDKELK